MSICLQWLSGRNLYLWCQLSWNHVMNSTYSTVKEIPICSVSQKTEFSGYSVYMQLLVKWELRPKIAEPLVLWPCFKHVWLITIKDNLLPIMDIIHLDIVDNSFCWLFCRMISKFSLRQRKRLSAKQYGS